MRCLLGQRILAGINTTQLREGLKKFVGGA